MRISSVFSALALTAAPLALNGCGTYAPIAQKSVEPFGKDDYSTDKEEMFVSKKDDARIVYAMPSTFNRLGNIISELSRVAGRDIAIVEPLKFGIHTKGFVEIPGIKTSPIETIPDEKYDPVLFQLEVGFKNNMGRNYSAYHAGSDKNPLCVITGDMNSIWMENFARGWTQMPKQISSATYEKKFQDRNSILVFTLLHEASHCTQSSDLKSRGFGNERDADRKAAIEYKKLYEKGWKINPDLPGDLAKMRRVQSILNTSTDPQNLLESLFEVHSIAGSASERDAMSDMRHTTVLGQMVKGTILEILPAEKRQEYLSRSARIMKPFMRTTQESIRQAFETYGKSYPDELKVISALVTHIEPWMTTLLAANYAQRDNPALTYQALDVLSRYQGQITLLCATSTPAAEAKNIKTDWERLKLSTAKGQSDAAMQKYKLPVIVSQIAAFENQFRSNMKTAPGCPAP